MRVEPSGMTPEEIAELIPHFKGSLIRKMFTYFDTLSVFPSAYRYATALVTLATCVPSDVTAPRNVSGFSTNFYTLLIGGSGTRKSSTAYEGMKLLKAVDSKLYASGIASPQGFEKQVKRAKGRICVYHSEFGHVLKAALVRQSDIKTFITHCFDGESISTETVGKGEMGIDILRISSCAACNYAFLFGYSELDDWNGGMFSRFFVAHSREKLAPRRHQENPDEEAEAWLVTRLRELHESAACRCVGFTDGAWDVYQELVNDMSVQSAGVGNDRFDAITQRIATIAVKIAMLYQIDAMMAGAKLEGNPGNWMEGGRFRIDPWCMSIGAQAARLHWRESQWIARRVPISESDRVRYRILEACGRLNRHCNGVTPLSLLISPESNVGLPQHQLEKYLASMCTEGVLKVERGNIGGRTQDVYRLLDTDPFAGITTADSVNTSMAAHEAALASLEE